MLKIWNLNKVSSNFWYWNILTVPHVKKEIILCL
jgi:hypothetical protein